MVKILQVRRPAFSALTMLSRIEAIGQGLRVFSYGILPFFDACLFHSVLIPTRKSREIQ